MGFLKRLGREEEKKPEAAIAKKTDLEIFCGDDTNTYRALFNTMFLDPRKIGKSMKDAADTARTYEDQQNFLQAKIWYDIAGGLAIYEGNIKKVGEYFGKAMKINNEKLLKPEDKPLEYMILENTEIVVKKAQSFYAKYLKTEESSRIRDVPA